MKKSVSIDKADIKAFLGPGSSFEGKLSFDEMVRLDGSFVGEINSTDTLVVGESAKVEGDIRVGALVLSGSFKGNVYATNMVDLRAPARVEGNIETPVLKIEEKVLFNGQVVMTDATPKIREMKTDKQ
ncbi:MAG TPA: polymer-forming cytoskeletal protein [Geopsychrobacteraceae bacterium]|nr:polymer-forming cytoskeletal protein [Geopsychrobacteraceae bacterium]